MKPTYIVAACGKIDEMSIGQTWDEALAFIWGEHGSIRGRPRDIQVGQWMSATDYTVSAAKELAARSMKEGYCPDHLADWIDYQIGDAYRAPTRAERAERDEERRAAA